jgi:hypothetical protein
LRVPSKSWLHTGPATINAINNVPIVVFLFAI